MGRLDGKVALIFGASPNNGGTAAHFMAREGAKIAVCDIVPEVVEETAKFLQSRGYEAIAFPGDASDEATVQSIVKQTVDHYGYVTTLLNMGGRQIRAPIVDFELEQWNEVISGYLNGAMLTTKHVARSMIEKDVTGGTITHITSEAGHQGEPGNSAYSSVKAAIINFARAAAMEFAYLGARVNTISPTFIEHNLWRFGQRPPRPRTRYNSTPEEVLQAIPLGRFARASDVANAAVFLASDESAMITGSNIAVDGGALAKYFMWTPGTYSGITLDAYQQALKQTRYGEEVAEGA